MVGGGEDGGGVERHGCGLVVLRCGRLFGGLCLVLGDIGGSIRVVKERLLGVYRYLQG